MELAIRLSRRSVGRTMPNPAVGCVIARKEEKGGFRLVGRGWTQDGGRPHAEQEALRRAGKAARGAAAYVTLEPCAHQGVTPPCAEALIAAGIARVIVALRDPDNRVAGRGLAMLRKASVDVCEDVGSVAAEREALGGYLRQRAGLRPWVTVKLAASLDGRIAVGAGKKGRVTGRLAQMRTHLLRARHDAIMIGVTTALKDLPRLDCRLPGLAEASPIRIILDTHARLRLQGSIQTQTVRGVSPPLWLVRAWPVTDGRAGERACALAAQGVRILDCPIDVETGRVDPGACLAILAGEGVTSLLVEGGAALASTLLGKNLVDRLAWFQAAVLFGGDARAAIEPLRLCDVSQAPRLRLLAHERLGEDQLSWFAPLVTEDDAGAFNGSSGSRQTL